MDKNKLSGYDRYILLTQQTKTMRSNMQAYGVFQEILQFVEKCSKTDAKVIKHNDEYVDKPITRDQAQRLLDKVSNVKWDNNIVAIGKFLQLDFRV